MLQQVPSQPEMQNIQEQLSAELQHEIERLQESHDSLRDDYKEEALEDLEDHLYDVGTRFNQMLHDLDNPYYEWIKRSKACRDIVDEIVKKANEAANAFQSARQSGYNRAHCRRRVQNVIIAMKNLEKVNRKR